jgi:hypothetical protein
MSTQLRLALLVTAAFGAGWTLSSCGSSSNSGTPSNNLFACTGSSCSSSDLQSYQTCVTGKCGDKLKTCYGPGALQGNFGGGQCGDYFTCVQKCGCSNVPCVLACGEPSGACQTCIETASACEESSGCSKPACFGSTPDAGITIPGRDGGFTFPDVSIPDAFGGILDADFGSLFDALSAPGTCSDLLACCNGMAAGPFKDTCTRQYDDLKAQGGDTSCMLGLNTLKLAGFCK